MLTLDDVDRAGWMAGRGDQATRHPAHSRWLRARALGAPYRNTGSATPLGRSALAQRCERVSPLLARANDLLSSAITELNHRGFAVALADQDGFILRCWGSSVFDDRRTRAGFAEGTRWNEAARGTNAIGTALAERTSVAVLGRAHYAIDAQELACYAALIRDPINGSIGVLDITGPFADADPFLGLLVESLAASVESSLFAETEERRVRTLRETLSQRDDVLAMVAHDLRNPLSAISLSAEALERRLAGHPRDPAPENRPLRSIARSTQRMARIIDDLLDVARTESGRLTVTPQRCPVRTIMDAACDIARTTAAGLRLSTECDGGAPDVLADRDRTLQVFANLIGNAAKFTPRGGALTLGCAAENGQVRFWARDSGPGIRREHLGKLFDRGWQARPSDRRGAGLGLYICKALVEAQGGEIGVESEPGRGATIHFTLKTA